MKAKSLGSGCSPEHRSRRRRALQGLLLLGLVALPLVFYLYQHRPDLYDRTRTDLLEANRQLDIYHHAMEALASEDRHGAAALRASLGWLHKAALSDPRDLAEINAIAAGLRQWEQLARRGELSSADIHERYRALEARVEQLIRKHTHAQAG